MFSFGQAVDCADLGAYWTGVTITSSVCRDQLWDSGSGLISIVAEDSNSGIVFSYLWTNNTTGFQSLNPTWGNLNSGFYTMVATGDNGCVMDTTVYLDSLSPVSDFDATSPQFTSNYTGPAPLEVTFTNNSSNYTFANEPYPYGNNPNASTQMYWLYDGVYEQASVSPVTKIFDINGLYEVCLVVVENLNGCRDTACIDIGVGNLGLGDNCENENCLNSFEMYPNPTQGDVSISYYINDGSSKSELKVLDLNGRLIYMEELLNQNNGILLPLSKIDSGIYMVNITSDKGQMISKRLSVE